MDTPLEQSRVVDTSNGNRWGDMPFKDKESQSLPFDPTRSRFTGHELPTFVLREIPGNHTVSQDIVRGAVRTLEHHNIKVSSEALSAFLDGHLSANGRSAQNQENLQDSLGSKMCSKLKACLKTGLSEVFQAEPSISRKIGKKAGENLIWEFAKIYPTGAIENQQSLFSQLAYDFQYAVDRLTNNRLSHHSREKIYKDTWENLEKTIEKLSQIYTEKYFRDQFFALLNERSIPQTDALSYLKFGNLVQDVLSVHGGNIARVFALAKAETHYKKVEQVHTNVDTIGQFYKRYKYEMLRYGNGKVGIKATINGELCYSNTMDVPNRTLTATYNYRHKDAAIKLPGTKALPNSELLWNVQRISIYAVTGEDISKDTFATTIVHNFITNEETATIVKLSTPESEGLSGDDGDDYRPEPKSDAFVTITGAAPNCLGQLYQLMQHEDVIGKQEITYLQTSADLLSGGIEMHIGDTQNQERVKISPQMWRLDQETLDSMTRSFFAGKPRSTTMF